LAEKIVLLHLPEKVSDIYGLWESVEATTRNATNLWIPTIGENIIL
jgi:hypothetical protein